MAADTVAAAVAVVVARKRPGVVAEVGSVRIASGAVVAGTDAFGAGSGPGISEVDQTYRATEEIDSLGLSKKLAGLSIFFRPLPRTDEEQTVEAVLQLKLGAFKREVRILRSFQRYAQSTNWMRNDTFF